MIGRVGQTYARSFLNKGGHRVQHLFDGNKSHHFGGIELDMGEKLSHYALNTGTFYKNAFHRIMPENT